MRIANTFRYLDTGLNYRSNILYTAFPYLLSSISLYTILVNNLDQYQDMTRSMLMNQDDTFDFIIVGAGSTGAVVANRLSENFKVLLLEAGGHGNPFGRIPLFGYPLIGATPEDWNFDIVSQKTSCFGLNNNKMIWHAGKGLGGTSLINGMIYLRGNVQGFDTLADKTNDLIWKLDNVLKYYIKVEDYDGFFDKDNHGQGGGMAAGKQDLSPFIDNLYRASQELGYNVTDPNVGPVIDGVAPIDQYTKRGARWSAYDGYIKPIYNTRPNLTIRKFSYVLKVLLDRNNNAIGVEYFRHGKNLTAKATKEVILSAGAIQSPKLLMLSGIGPKSHLEELKIPVNMNLPVGEKLQDKYGAFIGPFIVDEGKSFKLTRNFTITNLVKWLLTRSGPFTSTRSEASYSITSQDYKSKGQLRNPDISTYVMSFAIDGKLRQSVYKNMFNIKDEFYKSYIEPHIGKDAFIQQVTIAKPVGFGTIRLKDSNPWSPVLIDPKYLENSYDVERLIEGIKYSVKLVEETKSFKEINAYLVKSPVPGCEQYIFRSDEYWECYARTTTGTAYKYCATAPIGQLNLDPFAVVDSRLRVHGVKNLRVIDGSVLEEGIVSVNHVTCQMLGELASEFITQEYT